jgi:hypothetical protein
MVGEMDGVRGGQVETVWPVPARGTSRGAGLVVNLVRAIMTERTRGSSSSGPSRVR